MEELCLFIKIKTTNGKRERVREIWEKYVKLRAIRNDQYLSYYYCFDSQDPNVIGIFERFESNETMQKNVTANWFISYMEEVYPYLDEPSEVNMLAPVWIKYT
ncbi:MAG: hypothetical protein AAGF85_20170 [Bacteroidota bacterium]